MSIVLLICSSINSGCISLDNYQHFTFYIYIDIKLYINITYRTTSYILLVQTISFIAKYYFIWKSYNKNKLYLKIED